jgi:flagellar biosynthesis protein FliP
MAFSVDVNLVGLNEVNVRLRGLNLVCQIANSPYLRRKKELPMPIVLPAFFAEIKLA